MTRRIAWGDRRERGTRPAAQLKLRVRKRRASKYDRWSRHVELQWLGYHDRIGLNVRLARIAQDIDSRAKVAGKPVTVHE